MLEPHESLRERPQKRTRQPSLRSNALYQGAALQAAETLMFCIRARLYRLRKHSCFVSGRGFTGCGNTHVLYQGAALQAAETLIFCIRARLLQAAETLMFCIRARLYRLRKHSCFVSGHDFSRAVKSTAIRALAPGFFLCVLTKNPVQESNTQGLNPSRTPTQWL
jgi:small basic protein